MEGKAALHARAEEGPAVGHMTYAKDSLVQITYMCPWGSKTPADLLKPPPAKTKDKLVAYISSNCNGGGAVARTAYVEELMQYIQVDSFGLCLHNANLPEGKGWHDSFGNLMEIKMRAISEYKFFLAFENDDQVADYVTEKMLNALYAGTVPVYRGAPNVDDWVPGENSIIDIRDFDSPKELADFLLSLNEDDEAYNRYFEWKKNPWPPRFQTLLDNCVFFAECRLCQALAGARGESAGAANATLVGTPKGTIDAFSLEFNRVDTRIKLTDDSVVVPTSRSLELEDNYTLMAWINLNMINDGRIIDKASAGKIDGYAFDVRHASEGRGVVRLCAAGSCFTGGRRLLRGVWYHVAVTFRNANEGVRFYINGRLDKIATPSAPTANNSYPIKIGHPSNHYNGWRTVHKGGVFDGLIDDVAIFNRVLSPQDIRDLRYRRITGEEKGLAAYWGFNEGEGREVHDASPHHNDGIIYGSPRWVPTVTKPLFEETLVETM